MLINDDEIDQKVTVFSVDVQAFEMDLGEPRIWTDVVGETDT